MEAKAERITVTCKIHGGWWYMPLISVTDETVTVENLNGTPLELPRKLRDELRFVENGAML